MLKYRIEKPESRSILAAVGVKLAKGIAQPRSDCARIGLVKRSAGSMEILSPIPLFEGTPAPGPTHNAGLPSLLVCPDRTLLLAHRVGSHKNSGDGTQFLWRSRDGGKVWARIPFPFATTPSGASGEFRTAALSDIGRGRIAMLLTWIDHPNETAPLSNPKTEGLLPLHIGWTASSDNGLTWDSLREIPVAPFTQPCGNGPVLRLCPMGACWRHSNSTNPTTIPLRGRPVRPSHFRPTTEMSWAPPRIVAADPAHVRSYWDQHIQILADGTLLGLIWTDDRSQPGRSEITRVISRDGGASWSRPEATGLSGQYSVPLELPDSSLMLFYVVRHGDSAIRIALSPDGGETWRRRDDWVLYSQANNDLARIEGGNFAAYLQSMGRGWSFGWPSRPSLRPGEVLAAYYSGEGDQVLRFTSGICCSATIYELRNH